MLKKWFDWTPQDVVKWEQIRSKGLRHFILWYGIEVFGGGLFVLLGGAACWNSIRVGNLAGLAIELVFIALACLAGGIVNSLITWLVEEKLYRKYKTKG